MTEKVPQPRPLNQWLVGPRGATKIQTVDGGVGVTAMARGDLRLLSLLVQGKGTLTIALPDEMAAHIGRLLLAPRSELQVSKLAIPDFD